MWVRWGPLLTALTFLTHFKRGGTAACFLWLGSWLTHKRLAGTICMEGFKFFLIYLGCIWYYPLLKMFLQGVSLVGMHQHGVYMKQFYQITSLYCYIFKMVQRAWHWFQLILTKRALLFKLDLRIYITSHWIHCPSSLTGLKSEIFWCVTMLILCP